MRSLRFALHSAALSAVCAAAVCALAETSGASTPATDVSVQSPIDGSTFKLSEGRGKYVALHFLLKTECPYCIDHVRKYSRNAPAVAGVVHVFLKPDSDAEIKQWAAKAGKGDAAAPLIYRDPDATLAKQLGIPDGYKFHGELMHYPALILLDPDGKEVFRYVGKDNSDRLPFDQFAAKVAELMKNPALGQYNLPADRVAIKGYDPVAYFVSGKPVRGMKELSSQYRGVTYWFASETNCRLFAADPEKYVPTYGGWCATAMAKGKKVEIDPAIFKVTNGRLFLFYNGFFGDALQDWVRNEPAQTSRADANWKKISGE